MRTNGPLKMKFGPGRVKVLPRCGCCTSRVRDKSVAQASRLRVFGGVPPPEEQELPGETPGQLAGEDACATLSTAVASPRRGALRTAGLWFAAVREDKGIGTATRRMRFSNLFKNVRFAASGDAVCSESGHCALSIALPRQRPITHAAVARKRPPHLPASDRKECGRRAPRRWIWQWPIPGLFHCFCRRSRTARTNCL